MGDAETSPLRLIHLSVCSPAHLPAHWAKAKAFLWGHVLAFLSLGGLKARGGRFPFMYKGPLIRVMREGRAAGKGGDTGLGASAGQGGRPQAILPAGRLAKPDSGPYPGHGLRPPLDLGVLAESAFDPAPLTGAAHHPELLPCPTWRSSSFPRELLLLDSPSTSHGPGVGLPGLSPNWQVLENDLGLCSVRGLSPETSECEHGPGAPPPLLAAVPFSQDLPLSTHGHVP